MGETNTLEEFQIKFRTNELKILEKGSWSWSVRPSQPTLGAGILSLNRYALHLSDVTPEEMSDLGELIGCLEKAIRNSFNYNIMNYLMLMMVDHQVHYHVIPRYSGIKEFAGLKWVDNGWPALPLLGESQHDNEAGTLEAIQDTLKSALDM